MQRVSEAAAATDIDVVICAYTLDRWDQLVAAVRSCEAQSHPATRIIVVVDHNDELLARARVEFAAHAVVANRHRRGLSGARNTGLEEARATAVAFLDDDATAEPGWLAAFATHLADPAVGGAGGHVLPAWEASPPAWFPDEFLWVVGCSYRGLPTEVAPIRNPIGANMVFRRSLLESVGGFREEVGRVGALPVGCEETELSIQVRRGGASIVLVPDAVVHHHVPADRGRWRYFRTRCLSEGRSKAVVARLTGADEALESERSYASRTLPRGVVRALLQALRGPDRSSALARAGAIVAGLAVTTLGFVDATLRRSGTVT